MAADLGQLAAFEHAIQEAMRLYPAVYFTSREAPATFELTGYRKGSRPRSWLDRIQASRARARESSTRTLPSLRPR